MGDRAVSLPRLSLPAAPGASGSSPRKHSRAAQSARGAVGESLRTSVARQDDPSLGVSRTARPAKLPTMRDMLFGAEPWREIVDDHRAQRRAERSEAMAELAEYRRKHPPVKGSAHAVALQAPVKEAPRYAQPQDRSLASGRLPAIELARRGIEPPPLTPTPTDFELLQASKGAAERKERARQKRRAGPPGSPASASHPDSPRAGGGFSASQHSLTPARANRSLVTSLPPLPAAQAAGGPGGVTPRNAAAASVPAHQIDQLAFSSPGKYIAAKMAQLRHDKSAFDDFTDAIDAAEEARRQERLQRARALAPALEASRQPVDHEAARERERERRARAKQLHRRIVEDEAERRRDIVARDEVRQERSVAVRDAVQNNKTRGRNWLLVCSLVRSVAGFLLARQAGYRDRWIRLLVVYGARHWLRRTLRRRETFAGLRLNFFIRRNLPNMVESFRLRRCQRAAPLLRRFFDMYSYAMTFTVAMRNFMKHVRRAQHFVRHRRTVRMVMLASLRAAWDRECDRMRSEDSLLIEIPPKLRDVVLWKVYLAEAAAYGKLRHHILSEWRTLRTLHVDTIKVRLKALGKQAWQDPVLNAIAHEDAAYSELRRGAAKEAFVDKQFSAARDFLERDPERSTNGGGRRDGDDDDDVAFCVDEAYLMGDWFHARHNTGGRKDPGAAGDSDAAEASASKRAERSMRLLGATDQILHLKQHAAQQKAGTKGAGGGGDDAQLHPSMRFGQNKNVAYGDEASVAAARRQVQPGGAAVDRTPASGKRGAKGAASPAGTHLQPPGGAQGVKAAVASSQSRLGRTSSVHQNNDDGASSPSPAAKPLAPGRRKSVVTLDAAAGNSSSSSPPRAPWEVPRTKDGIVDEEYLIKRPKLPRRKLLTRHAVVSALIRQARDNIYAGMRRFREERAAAAAAERELMGDLLDDGASVSDASRSTTPQIPATSAAKPGQLKKNQSNPDAFIVPPEFDTHDAAYLARYIDFSWIAGFVTRVAPAYGPHGTTPSIAQVTTNIPGAQLPPSAAPSPQAVALGAAASPPQASLARAASFQRRGNTAVL